MSNVLAFHYALRIAFKNPSTAQIEGTFNTKATFDLSKYFNRHVELAFYGHDIHYALRIKSELELQDPLPPPK